jgi:Helix-turn-helix domain of resolvase/Resolvase, N terminal domain
MREDFHRAIVGRGDGSTSLARRAGIRAQRRHADCVEARPLGALNEAVDRNYREPASERHRVSQLDRSPRHDNRARSACFHMFGALAEFERSLIRERTQAGLAAARRVGRTGGRPPKLTDDDIEAAKAMLANPDIGVTQIAHRLGVSPATLYRYIPAARTANTSGG